MKIFNFFGISIILLVVVACGSEDAPDKADANGQEKTLSAAQVVDSSYQFYGAAVIEEQSIIFDFRKHEYRYVHSDSGLVRERILKEKNDSIVRDVWYKNELHRTVNDKVVALSDKNSKAYKSSINSVFYFAFLPKNLKDPAVNLSYLDEVQLKGEVYHKIKVTFDREGGGEDHEDVYLYWFNKSDYAMDYLAYSYETDGGGMRFRAAKNPRRVGGFLFQDYANYAPPEGAELNKLDALYEKGELKHVSDIVQKNIEVR
ncbi:MAG: DUF6503 family protein [Bacteroidota bacterium]